MTFCFDDRIVSLALNMGESGPAEYSAVVTDTREPVPQSLFVALHGDRYDGHDFLATARDSGAIAAVVRQSTPDINGLRLYRVADTRAAYSALARSRRAAIPGPVIAITGQNGKTSVKEMVASVLATRWRTHRTRDNDNNLIGVPKTILSAPTGTEALVAEAGANTVGEIQIHRETISPTVAIVTNAGSGHLDGFGSVERVREEKLSLTDSVPLALVGTNPSDLALGAQQRGAVRVLSAGLSGADLTPESVTIGPDGRPTITVDGQSFTLAARGGHQAGNAMFAWALVREYGLDPAAAADALSRFTLPSGRGEMSEHDGLTILNDGYNANPESFATTIELAGELRGGRRLVFIAGTMKELGEGSAELHLGVLDRLLELQPDILALVGDFVPAWKTRNSPFRGEVILAPNAEVMGENIKQILRGDELVVLKGSRGVALENILPVILRRDERAEA